MVVGVEAAHRVPAPVLLLRRAPALVVIHFLAAVRAERKPRQGIGLAGGVRAVDGLFDLLGQPPRLLIYEGLMGILENHPVLRRLLDGPLVLVRFLVGAEIDRVAHVLRLRQNIAHRGAAPCIRLRRVYAALPGSLSVFRQIVRRTLHLVGHEDFGDLVAAVTLDAQTKDTPHHGGGVLVDEPVVLVRRVFPIAVNRVVRRGLARLAPRLIRGGLLPAAITQIPLIHDVEERGELAAVLVAAVHAVANGDEAHAFLPEQNLRIEAGLEIVAPDAAHVLRQHRAHLPGLDVRNQPLPVRALERAARIPVVGIVDTICKAMLCRIVLQQLFLIDYGIAVPREVVVTGKPLIESGNLCCFRPPCFAHSEVPSGVRLICGVFIIAQSGALVSASFSIRRTILSLIVSVPVSLKCTLTL